MSRTLPDRPFLMLLSGFVLWSVAFVVLYAVQALGCRLAWDGISLAGPLGLHRAVLVGLFAAFAVLQVLLYLLLRKSPKAVHRETGPRLFAAQAAAHLGLVALGAAIFTFAGVSWLTTC
jgi:hypothetical protein